MERFSNKKLGKIRFSGCLMHHQPLLKKIKKSFKKVLTNNNKSSIIITELRKKGIDKMNKKEMINKLNKIMDEVEELQLELCTMLVNDSKNQELNFADNTLENAFNNLVDTEYRLEKSVQNFKKVLTKL